VCPERLGELHEPAGVGHQLPDGLVRAEPRRPRRQPGRRRLVEDRPPGDQLRRAEPPHVRPEGDVQERDAVAAEVAPPLPLAAAFLHDEGLLELRERRGHLRRRLGLVAVGHPPQDPERRRELRERSV
jgi:hypothetical protein